MNTAKTTTIVPVAALAALIAGTLQIGLDAPVWAGENPPLAALGPPEGPDHLKYSGKLPPGRGYYTLPPVRARCDWREDPDSGQYTIKKPLGVIGGGVPGYVDDG